MKVLLTGATGFLGSHLLKELLKNNHQVIVLKRSTSNTWRINEVISKVISYDIDKNSIQRVFEENKNIEAIVHTATCYGRNNERITELLNTNLNFPLEILEYALLYNVRSFFNTDTTLFKNANSYAMSKGQFVEWGRKFAHEKKIFFYNLKIEHMYGKLDDKSKFISFLKEKCVANEKIDLTLGEQKRDFIYIDDVIKVIYFLMTKQEALTSYFQEFEVGTGISIRIKYAAKTVKEVTKSNSILNFGALKYRENEIMDSKANLSELSKLGLKTDDFITFKKGMELLLEEPRYLNGKD